MYTVQLYHVHFTVILCTLYSYIMYTVQPYGPRFIIAWILINPNHEHISPFRFVRIVNLELADDYSLRTLPALAFFRHVTPILYIGDINNQEEVFEFLFQNKHTADEDIVIEDVDAEKLDILINHIDFVVVLFYRVLYFS